MRRALIVASLLWAVIAGTVTLVALPDVNPDVRLLVGVLSVVLPLAAVAAAWALHRGNDRLAVVLLLVTVATPTYMAWAINARPDPAGRRRGAHPPPTPSGCVGQADLPLSPLVLDKRGTALPPRPNLRSGRPSRWEGEDETDRKHQLVPPQHGTKRPLFVPPQGDAERSDAGG